MDTSVLTSLVGSLDKIAPSPFAFFTGGGYISISGSSAIGELTSAREVQVVTSNSNSAYLLVLNLGSIFTQSAISMKRGLYK